MTIGRRRLGAALQNQRTNHVATLELFHCQRQLEISAGNTETVVVFPKQHGRKSEVRILPASG